jgi:hypothetical protein
MQGNIYRLSHSGAQILVAGQPDWEPHAVSSQEFSPEIFINLSERFNPQPAEWHWCPWLENGMIPAVESIFAALTILHHAVSQGKRIYLHCDAGTHRSPSLLGFYIQAQGIQSQLQIRNPHAGGFIPYERDAVQSCPLAYAERYFAEHPELKALSRWTLETTGNPDTGRLDNFPILRAYPPGVDTYWGRSRFWWSSTRWNQRLCFFTPKVGKDLDTGNLFFTFGHSWVEIPIGRTMIQVRCEYCQHPKVLRGVKSETKNLAGSL